MSAVQVQALTPQLIDWLAGLPWVWDPHGYGYGYGVGVGIEIPSPRQP